MFSRFNNIHAAQLVASIGSRAAKDEQVRGRYQKSGEKEWNETRRNKRQGSKVTLVALMRSSGL